MDLNNYINSMYMLGMNYSPNRISIYKRMKFVKTKRLKLWKHQRRAWNNIIMRRSKNF